MSLLDSGLVSLNASAWAKLLLRKVADGWHAACVTSSGLFHPYLNRQWRPIKDGGPRTLVSQCRLIYNFSRAYQVFGESRFADATVLGIAALETYFRVSPGLHRWSVNDRGEEVDGTINAYGHAFAVLGLSTAASALGDATLARRAADTWRAVQETLRDDLGGLIGYRSGAPQQWDQPRSQNPLMHSFEALMTLYTAVPNGYALSEAKCLLRFMRSLSDFEAGRLVEWHTPQWQPQPVQAQGHLDLGHQFEWAWQLSEWASLSGDPEPKAIGDRFLQTALELGLDQGW